jgi:hypothetical protein
MLPAEAALLDLGWGIERTQIAGALVRSGIADALAGTARHPTDVARQLNLDEEVTARLLASAVGIRLASADRVGRVRLTRLGGPLRAAHPRTVASYMAHQAAPARAAAYANLDSQLRLGAEPSGHRRAFGNSIWEYLADHPSESATFAAAMRELSAIDMTVVDAYPWPDRGVICDVSGGVGALLAAILAGRAQLRGILVDSPSVIEQAEQHLRLLEVSDRIERQPGDLFGDLDARADVYVLKWVLHNWSDDACRGILGRVGAAMPSGAKVVTIDWHLDRSRPDIVTPLLDLQMLAACEGGRERSPDEVHALMRDAGLRPGPVRHAGLNMLVEGIAA